VDFSDTRVFENLKGNRSKFAKYILNFFSPSRTDALREIECVTLFPLRTEKNSYRGLRQAESSAFVKGGEASFRVSMETVFLSPLTFCFSFLSFLFLPFSHSPILFHLHQERI